jgi:hypothetical protein
LDGRQEHEGAEVEYINGGLFFNFICWTGILLDKSIFCVVSADVCCWFDGTGVGRVPVFSLDELLTLYDLTGFFL